MSSLASQLATIKQAVATNANFQKRAKVASVLFTASEAADQDLDQVFAIASNGFSELCAIDPRLVKFGQSLFSSAARGVDRRLQNAADNALLDRRIAEFVDLAAPHLALRPMLKCMEWLIRRFEAERFLAEQILFACLPHFRISNFSHVLGALALPTDWSFLTAYRQSRESPQVSTFVRAFARNPALFSRYVEYVHLSVSNGLGYHGLVALYADVVVRTISQLRVQGTTDEELYARLLPTLIEGLHTKTLPEYQVSTYMVMAVLSASRTMAASVCLATCEALVRGLDVRTAKSGIVCLAQMLQTLDGFHEFSPSAIDVLLRNQDLRTTLLKVGQQYRAEKMLVAVGLSAIVHKLETHSKFLQSVIRSPTVGKSGQQALLAKLCDIVRDRPPQGQLEAVRRTIEQLKDDEHMRSPLRLLARRLGDDLAAIEKALQATIMPIDFLNTEGQSMVVEVQKRRQQIDPIHDLVAPPQEASYMSIVDARHILASIQGCTSTSRWASAFEHEVLRGSEARQVSLLVRAALSSIDTFVQSSALEQLSKFCASQTLDFQMLLPVLLSLLSSKNKFVRRRALDLARTINEGYERLPQAATIYGETGFYGPGANADLRWLSAQDAQRFLADVILDNAEECLLDHKVIYKSAGRALTTHGTKGKVLAHRVATLHFLAGHLLAVPVMKVKLKLLLCLDRIEQPTSAKTKAVAPLLGLWLKHFEAYRTQCAVELIDAAIMERLLFRQIVADEHSPTFVSLKALAERGDPVFGGHAISRLGAIIPDLRKEVRAELMHSLLTTALGDQKALSEVAIATLRDLIPSGDNFQTLLDDISVTPPSSNLSSPAKRARKELSSMGRDTGLRRLTLVLELLEQCGAKNFPDLLPGCFDKLSELIVAEIEVQAAVSYTQQILLSCMNEMIDAAESGAEFLRIDILINCIRSSSSPQVQNRALLLVSKLAQAAPEQVLHGVMPIFTFMSANILRQDDGFSTHVIHETIRNVIPPLLNALEANSEEQAVNAADILRNFVDAIPHIARHRRSKLFVDLIEVMGAQRYLAPILHMLVRERAALSASRPKTAELRKSYEELCVLLLRHSGVGDQLQALLSLAESAMHAHTPEGGRDALLLVTKGKDFTLAMRSGLLALTSKHLSSKKNWSVLQTTASSDDSIRGQCAALFAALLRCAEVEDLSDTAYEALDRLVELLSVAQFRLIVLDALSKPVDESLQVRVLQMVAKRATSMTPGAGLEVSAVLSLVDHLSQSIQSTSSPILLTTNLQTISTIGRKLGKLEQTIFNDVMTALVKPTLLAHSDLLVRVSAIDCLTTMVLVFGPRFLPHLPATFSIFASTSPDTTEMETNRERDVDGDLLPLAMFAFFEACVRTIPTFMTAYTQLMLERVVQPMSESDELASEKAQLVQVIADRMQLRPILRAIDSIWTAHVGGDRAVCLELLEILDAAVEQSSRDIVAGAVRELSQLFQTLLDLRKHGAAWLSKDTDLVEARCIQSVLQVILKLSDSTFRPLFLQLHRWSGTRPAWQKDTVSRERQLTFLKFFAQLTAKFKALVLPYFDLVIDGCVGILDTATRLDGQVALQDARTAQQLWTAVISCLQNGFDHDNEDHWRQPGRFDRIAPLLCQQLELADRGYPVTELLTPCLVALTVACASDDNFKIVNTAVLARFRHEAGAVRLAAVQTCDRLCARIGEEWLTILPQTIPFLAESMEDDDERVEKASNRFALTIEGFLGESIEKYL